MGTKKKSTLGYILILLALAPFKLVIAQAPIGIAIAVIAAIIGFFMLLSSDANDNKTTTTEERNE